MSTKHLKDDDSSLPPSKLKSKIQREGIWPQYTQRIKTLERTEKEFWKLFSQENDSARKRAILEDLVNLQPVLSNRYTTAVSMLIPDKELKN